LIELIRMINMQSYKDITFNLTGEINVFDAPNETGKSVVFKVFRTMCDANWYGRGERKSLIRRGEEKGTAMLIVPHSEGSFKIVFEVYKTYQVYHLFDGNEHLDSWKQDNIPEDLIEILGWYYDKESKVLLNLCDQELDMPFVNSNSRFNYEVMRFIIQNPELETARDNISDWIRKSTDEIEILSTRVMTLENVIKDYKYVDVASLEDSIHKREEALTKGSAICNMIGSLQNIVSIEQPTISRVDDDKLDDIVNKSNSLRSLGITLQKIIGLEKPTIKEIDVAGVDNAISIAKLESSMIYNLYRVKDIIAERDKVSMLLQNSIELLRDFERENSVCPLCGQEFNKHVMED